MSKRVMAKIYWLSPEEGGRKFPPTGPRYSTVSRFEEDLKHWPDSAWSIVAEFDASTGEVSGEIEATIWFLAEDKPDAPLHLLHPGSKFELLEGQRVVARGKVIG